MKHEVKKQMTKIYGSWDPDAAKYCGNSCANSAYKTKDDPHGIFGTEYGGNFG